MSDTRYPTDLVVTLADFHESGWQQVVAGKGDERYSSMWHALSDAARAAVEAGSIKRAKVLWLLADATSMRLTPDSTNQPFHAMAIFGDRRSTLPEDFSEADVSFFQEVAPGVSDARVRARLADLVWLLKKAPRLPAMAVAAIDAYRELPLDRETWMRDGRECWSRALSLARSLGDAAGQRLQEIEVQMLSTVTNSSRADRFFPRQLADVMQKHGLARQDRLVVAAKLEGLGKEADDEGDVQGARVFYEAAATWYTNGGDKVAAARPTAAEAECWVRQAEIMADGAQPNQIAAATFYENAIQTYRTIGRVQRTALGVDDRIEELRARLTLAGEQSLGQMGIVRMPAVNIDEIVKAAREAVAGKPLLEAFAHFAAFFEGVDVAKARKEALESLRSSPLQALFGATHFSREGRVVAKRPAFGLAQQMSETEEEAVWSTMVRDHMLTVRLLVQGEVGPALRLLTLEHRLLQDDFVQLARNAAIVPKDRAAIVGNGLYAGFDGDFVTAVHVLVPQLENLVRHHLKAAGAVTSHLDKSGVETENGLSTLMELPQAVQVFGESRCFEIKAVFCSPYGPNLRNELAHGLLDDDACQSVAGVYAWWFMFRLVYANFWNARYRGEQVGGPTPDPADSQGGEPAA